jgi:poly-gamma-glutamate synthesis protein (capsule biosynthesis protein)
MIRLLIAGDFYPGTRTHEALAAGEVPSLMGPLLSEFEGADLVTLNLEGPLIARSTPIRKVGPHHGTPESCSAGLRRMKVGLVNLANNHVMDHGEEGLRNTMEVCRREEIAWVGGGRDIDEASLPWIREVNGVRLAVIAQAEHEFGMAGRGRCGANPLDPIAFVRTVKRFRGQYDRLLVLLHAGNEYCPYPRPSVVELCRFLVEQGADAVVCQHSHCIGCFENYQGGIIIHGQGNFIFDDPRARDCEKEGMLVGLQVYRDRATEMRLIPFKQASGRAGIEPMGDAETARLHQQLYERNARLLDADFLERVWRAFCRDKRRSYLGIVHGLGRRLRNLDARLGILSPFFSKRHALMMLHMVRCESHREVMEQVLSDETGSDLGTLPR